MEEPSPSGSGSTILIFTAAIGGGHRALADAIRDDLSDRNQRVVVIDGLNEIGRLTAWTVRSGYVFQLKHAPWSIRPVFVIKTQPFVAARMRTMYGLLCGWRLYRSIERIQPVVIVSTYPVFTLILSSLRRRGRLHTPVVTVIADYGAHPMWVGPETELHIVSAPTSRELVRQVGGRAVVGLMPVATRFRAEPDRSGAPIQLPLAGERFVVLIVGGAWGIGEIEPAVASAIEAGTYPVIVTGNNRDLKERLEARFPDPASALILGWTDDMPGLMAAADCLVQNAGGMTCHEAAAMQLPVIFFRPIPGHGEMNAEVMVQAGAACWAKTSEELTTTLKDAASGRLVLPTVPRSGIPVASTILDLASKPRPVLLEPARVWPRRLATSFVTVMVLLIWLTVTPWTGEIGAMMLPKAVTSSDVPVGSVSVVVRTWDPQTAHAIEDTIVAQGLPVALFVDENSLSGVYPADGVTIGFAQHESTSLLEHPIREWQDSESEARLLRRVSGSRQIYVLPPFGGRTLFASFLAPRHALQLGARHQRRALNRSGIVAIDLQGLTPEQAVERLDGLLAELKQDGIQCVRLPVL
jgi:processive 1,2-diacylglycerol beta-glucosyltransferase